ncbi:MAG: L-histidine N(alpha)-methyltransferase, partial [Deltaproteobacteria bacterium]
TRPLGAAMSTHGPDSIAGAVRTGLTAPRKWLPPFLFYDEQGSALFEKITELPEYYVTRTERSILERDAERIATRVLEGTPGPIAVLELGAGNAIKTDILLRAFAKVRNDLRYFPADVSPTPLEAARERLASSLPALCVSPIVGTHADAMRSASAWEGSFVVLYLGSSIGNYEDADASVLLTDIRGVMGRHGALLLGVDRTKPLDVLLAAYDDRAGVTAAFNLNVLARINRELQADFVLDAFRHVALWNESASAIEMHLESVAPQSVHIAALDLTVRFDRGERIHTESSHKYTDGRVRDLFDSAGLLPVCAYEDAQRWFAVHVARAG